ncbi:MAG: hypothetical protein ACM362_04455, partial [Candidatus Methylomirabilota bacterium]
MATETAQKRPGGTGFWIILGALAVVNIVIALKFGSRDIELHHAPIVQLPNFLHFLGVPGVWMPAHITFTWLVMAFLVLVAVLGTRALRPVP